MFETNYFNLCFSDYLGWEMYIYLLCLMVVWNERMVAVDISVTRNIWISHCLIFFSIPPPPIYFHTMVEIKFVWDNQMFKGSVQGESIWGFRMNQNWIRFIPSSLQRFLDKMSVVKNTCAVKVLKVATILADYKIKSVRLNNL